MMPRHRRDLTVPTRRHFIRYLSLASLAAASRLSSAGPGGPLANVRGLDFEEIAHGVDPTHHVPPGYVAQVLLRWGDPILPGAPAWSPGTISAAGQATQFGYNNDFVAFMPLPLGSASSARGLLCVNHEFTNTQFIWPGLNTMNISRSMSRERTAAEMAAVGHSVVEIELGASGWRTKNSPFNRRLTADSPMRLSGPAAGHTRVQTNEDTQGYNCRGVINPCSGGKTPWSTVLIADENFNLMFAGHTQDRRERRNHQRYGVGSSNVYSWWPRHFERFNVARDSREANRFGWVVELDPYETDSMPIKRTALGRFKHEAATCALNRDGRVVVYLGDDETFEYLYKFVSAQRFDASDRSANRNLLDEGTLYTARFYDDGRLEWLPLRFGSGPLTRENDFHDQGEVLIETRRAADLVGATRLDRPEDVEANLQDGVIYAMLTNNTSRHMDALDAANPRSHNAFGHILKLLPPGAPGTVVDHAADEFQWEIFLLAGNPDEPAHHARYPGAVSANGWLASPDNCAFDPKGRLWIASDQGRGSARTGIADGLWACGEDAVGRFVIKRFFRAPIGAEVCGPEFTPDGRTLFLAIQHPGVNGADYDHPGTRWPDFEHGTPPRPAVLAITREDGDEIGV